MDKQQLTSFIETTLNEIKLHNIHAVNLINGTAAQESAYGHYIRQLGSGPALGIFQMEPNTFMDIVHNYLDYRPQLKRDVMNVCNVKDLTPTALMYNLKLAVVFCRLHYLRVPEPLPTTIDGYARYWKQHYNTILGKGTETEFIYNYKKYVL
jgi:hypothetical protein